MIPNSNAARSFAGQIRTFFLILSVLFFAAASSVSAQEYKVEKTAAAPPQELSAAVRGALAGGALRVTGPNGVLCELWLRKDAPGLATPAQGLGITYGQLAEGTLLGAVRFPAAVKDYRKQTVKPGVYTLRYELIPVDGNHMGVAPQRDFVLAAPAADDPDIANVSHDQNIALGRKTTGTKHPSVWSLTPVDDSPSELPKVTHDEDDDFWILEFALPVAAGEVAKPVAMGLVVVGSAPEA